MYVQKCRYQNDHPTSLGSEPGYHDARLAGARPPADPDLFSRVDSRIYASTGNISCLEKVKCGLF